MKRRMWVMPVAAALAAVSMAGTASADIHTDKSSYQAGETVVISGDGLMTPGETVVVTIGAPDGSVAQRHEVTANEAGDFSDSWVAPSIAGDYPIVAVGQTSGVREVER